MAHEKHEQAHAQIELQRQDELKEEMICIRVEVRMSLDDEEMRKFMDEEKRKLGA